MGEIKSTLELILEKTKGLSMTSEEKEAFRLEEWLKKSRGWIQKYLDDLEDLEKVREELFGKGTPPKGWEAALEKEIVTGLDPEKDEENEKRFRLLTGLLDRSAEPLRRAIQEFKDQMAEEASRREVRERESLKALGISGDAVLPNLGRDPSWRSFYETERAACLEKLAVFR